MSVTNLEKKRIAKDDQKHKQIDAIYMLHSSKINLMVANLYKKT